MREIFFHWEVSRDAIRQGIHNEILLAFPVDVVLSFFWKKYVLFIFEAQKLNQQTQKTACHLHSWFLFVYGLTVICMDFFNMFFFILLYCLCTCFIWLVDTTAPSMHYNHSSIVKKRLIEYSIHVLRRYHFFFLI